MIWLIFALIAAFADGAKSLVHRFVMKTESIYSYALLENILTAVAFLPLLYLEFAIPKQAEAWAILIVSSLLWTAISLVGFAAYKYTPVTIKEPISQSRLIFVLLLSAILLSETMTAEKIIGTGLIFLGILIVTFHKQKLLGRLSDKGVQLTIVSAILISFVAIIDKLAMDYFTPGTYGFLVYFLPGLIILAISRNEKDETKKLISSKGKYVLAVVLLGVIGYYSLLRAYSLADASLVFPVIRLSSLFSVLGGLIVFREERTEIAKKILSILVIILGVLLISGYFSLL